MIDKEILDAVIPVPTLEEAKDEKVAELKEEGKVGNMIFNALTLVSH